VGRVGHREGRRRSADLAGMFASIAAGEQDQGCEDCDRGFETRHFSIIEPGA